jgi:LEA14-like dessication related protein
MDLLKAFELLIDKDVKVTITLDGKELVEVKGRDRNIDISIKDEDAARELVKELRKWRS